MSLKYVYTFYTFTNFNTTFIPNKLCEFIVRRLQQTFFSESKLV